jgi:hypothetical protein
VVGGSESGSAVVDDAVQRGHQLWSVAERAFRQSMNLRQRAIGAAKDFLPARTVDDDHHDGFGPRLLR